MSNDYTDKVLDYFRNPRNMGKIDDADGIGKVGNPQCLAEDEFLHTNSSVKTIKNFFAKDKVIGASGRYSKVDQVFFRNYQGDLLAIKNRLGETLVTPDHLILAKKVPIQKDKFKRIKGKQELPSGWFHAEELERGDITLFPIFKEVEDKEYIDLRVEKRKFDFKSKTLPSRVPLNDSFLRLCGYYLSEGWVSIKTTRKSLGFVFNVKERDLINDTAEIIKDLWNLKVAIKRIKERNTATVITHNTFLVDFFKEHFNKGAENKKIPNFIMNLSPEKQRHLIYGLWKGDGYTNLNIPRAGYTTISYQLVSQLKLLLLRQKIVPSIYTEEEKVIKGVKHRKSYRINVGDRQSLKNLFKILGIKHSFKSFPRRKTWIDDNFAYLPITQTKKVKYKGKVYDMKVPGEHSFATASLCAHNCGDIMWIYIKVKDNVITDCKFETFGCVAAIATSSVLTELVKNKTIEEALKVTNKDVARELGGLPPIKMHCSMLAEQGLKSAVEDYRRKRG